MPIMSIDQSATKRCAYCLQDKPLSEFRKRTGRRSKGDSRRGACRECRKHREAGTPDKSGPAAAAQLSQAAPVPKPAASRRQKALAAKPGEAMLSAPGTPAQQPGAAVPGGSPGREPASPGLPAEAGGGGAPRRKRRRGPRKRAAAAPEGVPGSGAAPSAPVPESAFPPDSAQPQAPAAPVRRKRRRSRRKATAERKLHASAAETAPKPLPKTEPAQPLQRPRGPKPAQDDVSALMPSKQGMILMRGHSDKGRRWHQEIDLELAVTLVREQAAIVVGRRTIRRLYSNKDFRKFILTRDRYTCHFCGQYGDTIDHLLPRAKGGHTTPLNCVCACNLCNQAKADQLVDEFMGK